MVLSRKVVIWALAASLIPSIAMAQSQQTSGEVRDESKGQVQQTQKPGSVDSRTDSSDKMDVGKLMEELEPGKDTEFYRDKLKEAGYTIVSTTYTIEKEGQQAEVDMELEENSGEVKNVRINPSQASGGSSSTQQRQKDRGDTKPDRMAAAQGQRQQDDQDKKAKMSAASGGQQDAGRDKQDKQRMAGSDKKAQDRDVAGTKSTKDSDKADATDPRQFSDRYQEEQLVTGVSTLPLEDSEMFRQELEKRGYQIAKHEQKDGKLEIDAVKQGRVLTVTVDVDEKTGKARKIQTSDLRWESQEVERSMTGRGSGSWSAGQNELQRALQPGKTRDAYAQTLEKLGYDITSVNYDQPNYVEYEVVKGQNSYEVKIDFKDGRQATGVQVDANWWKASRTKQAVNR